MRGRQVTPERQFESEPEIFRTETQTAAQFFYAYLTIHAVVRDCPSVYRLLNQAPLFGNTNLGALQTGSFRYLRSLVRKHRTTYEANYRDLRHKLFAHKEVSDPAAVSALFARTNIRELQRILLFLLALYDALWTLFVNGRKPILRMRRYSVARIRKKPSAGKGSSLQERLIREIERFLLTAAVQSTEAIV